MKRAVLDRVLKSYPMCPHCGKVFKRRRIGTMIPEHPDESPGVTNKLCAGRGQIPRNHLTDRRPLWNGQPNPHAM